MPPVARFNLLLKWGPYEMRLIETDIVPTNAFLWADGKAPQALVNARITREQQYDAIWKYIFQTIDRDLVEYIAQGKVHPDQAMGLAASCMPDILNANPFMRSLGHFEKAVSDTPVTIEVPKSIVIQRHSAHNQ